MLFRPSRATTLLLRTSFTGAAISGVRRITWCIRGSTVMGLMKRPCRLRRRSYALFMDDWKAAGHTNENYHAWGGNGGGDTHYTWGALLCLVALEQYIDENPWEGLRFGALNATTEGEFHGASWANHMYDVVIGPKRTALVRDGKLCFEADSAVVVRDYQPQSFTIRSQGPVRITTAEYDTGSFDLKVDGKPAGTTTIRQGRATFALTAGDHAVQLAR